MSRRKSKKPPQDDVSILLDSSVPKSRRKRNSHASPALLSIIIFTVGASIMGWFCVQQQQSLDQLSESCATMQMRIARLQQVMAMTDAQTDTDWDVEERIFALEEAQKQAQERAAVALAASEKLKNSDLYSQLLDLRNEMSTGLAAIKQVSLSFTTLQDILKNRSEELEALKESVVASLNSSSALAENVAGLTNAVASAYSRVDGQIASVGGLNTQLEGHISELNELKESMHLYNVALHTDDQKTAAVKLEEAERQGAEEEADEEAKEVEAMQEEQPLEAEVDGEEDITPEEQEDEEITGQSEEQTVDGHIMDIMESLEEEISEEVGEIVEEESIQLNSEVFIDQNEEDE